MDKAIDTQWKIPVAFYFQVEIGPDEVAFKEVSGLSSEMELETIQEGGVNEYEHRLPKQIKHGNLILKRALMPVAGNSMVKWIRDVLEDGNFFHPITQLFPLTQNIRISLLSLRKKPGDEEEMETVPIYRWECTHAYPVKWETEGLDAEKNSILIESVEFAYSSLKRVRITS